MLFEFSCFRLHDVGVPFPPFAAHRPRKLVAKVECVAGQDPGGWKEAEILGIGPFHSQQVPSQVVLSRYLIHPREVVNLLVSVHLSQVVGRDR